MLRSCRYRRILGNFFLQCSCGAVVEKWTNYLTVHAAVKKWDRCGVEREKFLKFLWKTVPTHFNTQSTVEWTDTEKVEISPTHCKCPETAYKTYSPTFQRCVEK